MCVTNTTQRRPVRLTEGQVQPKPSAQAQRICNSIFQPPPTSTTTAAVVNVKPAVKRRKPQKPGKTAKNHDRHFVVHSYHDHSRDLDIAPEPVRAEPGKRARRGGVTVSFPMKLHTMLLQIEKDGLGHIISWQPHGRCFVVHKPKRFVDEVLPHYFKQTKMTSFQRQLNLYGFQRITQGKDQAGYYHELFLRGKEFLCKRMTRTKVKGTGYKAASSPDQEPDFWRMPPVNPITPQHSEDDASTHSAEESEEQAARVPSCAQQAIPSSCAFQPPRPDMASTAVEKEEKMDIEPIPLEQASTSSSSSESTEILDEVVDELFLQNEEENDDILDFVNTWNPDSFEMQEDIVDDVKLGVLLERILAE